MTEKFNTIKEEILAKIRTQEVSMRPKAFFTLKVAALVALALAVLVLTVFLCNFIFFIIRLNHHDALLGMGPRGVWAFLQFFPWAFFMLDIALILVLERVLREFSFGYRTPVVLSVLIVAALIISGAAFIDRGTGANDELLRRAEHEGLPSPLKEFYEHARHPLPPEVEPEINLVPGV